MKKNVLSLFSLFILLLVYFSPIAHAQVTPTPTPASIPVTIGTQPLPSEGAWIIDPEVTTVGKNASRSGMLLDWTLKDYKWSSDTSYTNNPLTPFWLIIQRIVYSLFLFVILVTAFILIVTRGKSLTAKRFLPRFLLVVLLVTFSFSLVQFLYQIVDIFQGFFLKNPRGDIISSRDLLFIGFDYRTFQGLRVFGESYNESAFISLLLVKLTSFTYYVMAILLIFRKIILWFLIIISPVFPLLLLFYPLRNTAKIWIGEFFRWLLYAPLFAILLSGLVRLWSSGLPLFFSSVGVGKESSSIYPTAVNILLGGPGQHIGINNSVNLPDTFALYLVALLMLWAVIILPFILLQIFLDYMMAFNNRDNPFMKQIFTMLNNRPTNPLPPTPTPPVGAGLARNLPFARRFSIPKTTGLAREVPRGATQAITRPTVIQRNNQTEISRLTNLSIPTMRDIARFETTKLSHDVRTQQEIERTRQNLINIANPASVSSVTERERVKMIHDRLVTEGQKGSQVATTILNAANTYNSYSSSSSTQSAAFQITKQLIENLSQPTTIISKRDQQKIVEIRQELVKAADSGNQFAKTVLTTVNNYTNSQVQSLQKILTQLANPQKLTDVKEKETFTTLREKISSASKSGNPLATLISQSLESSTSTEQVKKIQQELLSAKAQGNPLATELLKTVSATDKTSEKDMEKLYETLKEESKEGNPLATLLLRTLSTQEKTQAASVSATAKLKSGVLPQVNRIQQVSLDDYEAVKKMWADNYKNLEVPNSQQTRKQWIDQDISSIQETISLLSSANPQDVERGMQQVSDILPFLLIGGFSQTEIIAYLKAKLEAGKGVLESVSDKEEEEDTLLNAERAAKQATGHMTASIEINASDLSTRAAPVPVERVITQPQVNNTFYENNTSSTVNTVQVDSPSSIISQLKLPLPTLRDIASFETKKEGKTVQDLKKLFIQLASPETVASPGEQKNLLKIKQTLQDQAQKGDSTAQMIVSALGLTQTMGTVGEKHDFLMTLKTILDPSLAPEDDQTYYRQVRDELVKARQHSDIVAIQIMKLVDKISQTETESIVNLLHSVNNPDQINNEKDKMTYTSLKKDLESQKETSQTASSILLAAQNEITSVSANKIRVKLLEEASQQDPLATRIMKEYITLPQSTIQEINNLYQTIQKSSSDPFSKLLLKVLNQPTKRTAAGVKIERFPRENSIQKVSLDDYEQVKQMLYEMYVHGIVPPGKTGKEQSRIDWITEEKQQVEEVINLLSSDDMSNVQLGMTKVNDILPFLLLGGFSQNEVLQYLKAKQEAAGMALQTLSGGDEKVFVEKKEDIVSHPKMAAENSEPVKE
jgi:hypothetical protein